MAERRGAGLTLADANADGVADLIEQVCSAGGFLAAELDRIAASRTPVSEQTILRLEAVIRRLRPAARMRARLGELAPAELEAGVHRWAQRQAGAAAREAR